MLLRHLLPINPWQGLGKQPLAHLSPQFGSSDVLAVNIFCAIPTAHPIVACIVGDLDQFIGHRMIADLPSALIVRREALAIVIGPTAHRTCCRHISRTANLVERHPLAELAANLGGKFKGEIGATARHQSDPFKLIAR